jgi:hypothetical protein
VTPFRRVEARSAGAQALGILVPLGPQTLVILRPRALPWDLLPARWDGDSASTPVFCQFGRDEAAGVARRLQQALERGVASGINPVQTVGDARGEHFQVWLRSEEYVWLVCRRAPGQAYRPAIFASHDEALREAERLTPIVWPDAEAQQEYYFNTQQFTHRDAKDV